MKTQAKSSNGAEENRDLSLTIITQLDRDYKRLRDFKNRIKAFTHQIDKHQDTASYNPLKAQSEVIRLKKLQKYYTNNYLINNNSKLKNIKKELNQWDTIKKHWEKTTNTDYIKNVKIYNPLEETMLSILEQSAIKARKQQILWRIRLGLREAHHNGWYIIFNTLTISTDKCNHVWNRQNRVFAKYIYQFDKITGKDNHNYFAVVEEGSINSREHIHVIHTLKDIPNDWKTDPNKSKLIPTNRIIDQARSTWQYGFSSPIAVRINASDAYSRLNWQWPVTHTTSQQPQPIESGTSDKLASYVSKYLTKTLEHKGENSWKVKIRQKFGLTILNHSIKQLNNQQIKILLRLQNSRTIKILEKPIPLNLLKVSSHREMLKRLTKSKRFTLHTTLTAQDSIMKRLSNLTQPTTIYNQQNSTYVDQRKLQNTEISKIQDVFDIISDQTIGTHEIPATSFIITGNTKYRG